MRQSNFARHYSSTGFRLWRHRAETRRPLVRLYRHIRGFVYVGLGPLAVWVDGRRIGIGRR